MQVKFKESKLSLKEDSDKIFLLREVVLWEKVDLGKVVTTAMNAL